MTDLGTLLFWPVLVTSYLWLAVIAGGAIFVSIRGIMDLYDYLFPEHVPQSRETEWTDPACYCGSCRGHYGD